MDVNDLRNRFEYHPPQTRERAEAHQVVRTAMLGTAIIVNDAAPDGREKSLAITHLEQAMMWANAAIAREQE